MQRGFQRDRFREARMKRYPSQRKFAAALTAATGKHLGQSHISAIERGVNEPSVSLLTAISQLLDVTPDFLLGFDYSAELTELTQLLAKMPSEDVELVWKIVQRMADQRTRQESEWISLWRDVLAIGGQDLIGRFERVLGVSAPPELRHGTGVHNIDQPAKVTNGGFALA